MSPLARAFLELDQESEAEAVLTEGMERAHAQNHRLSQAEMLRVQGMLRTRQERWQEAREALAIFQRLGAHPYVRCVQESLARFGRA